MRKLKINIKLILKTIKLKTINKARTIQIKKAGKNDGPFTRDKNAAYPTKRGRKF